MKSELSELIEYLESERDNLEIQKKECLQQWDYKGAHYFFIALQEVNHQLNTLYNLNDPDYDLKRRLESQKSFYDPDIRETYNDNMKDYFANKRKELDEQIQNLNNRIKKQSLDGQEFDDAIYELIEKKISGFKFHLKKQDNLFLEFRLQHEKAMIISTTLDEQSEEGYLMSDIKQKLPALGFTFNEKNNSMECFYNLTFFKNSFEIKILVSRVIFDILYYKSLDDPAYIEKY